MGAFVSLLRADRVVLADGAWGTSLRQRGLAQDAPPEAANLDQPGIVSRLACDFAACGVALLGANTFGANPIRLAPYGLRRHADAINRAGCEISARAAMNAGALLLPAIGPSGVDLAAQPERLEEVEHCFAEQAAALAAAGARCVAIETMYSIAEARAAIRAAIASRLETACLFTFERAADGALATRCGATPARAVEAALAAGAMAAGVNCCDGPETVLEAIRLLRAAHPGMHLIARPSAGLPRQREGRWEWPESPRRMGEWACRLREAGASVVGGCCGCAPQHIAAMARRLSE